MNETIRAVLSGLIAGLMTLITSLVAVWAEMDTGAALWDMGQASLGVAIGGGLLTALKDWQKSLSKEPPK